MITWITRGIMLLPAPLRNTLLAKIDDGAARNNVTNFLGLRPNGSIIWPCPEHELIVKEEAKEKFESNNISNVVLIAGARVRVKAATDPNQPAYVAHPNAPTLNNLKAIDLDPTPVANNNNLATLGYTATTYDVTKQLLYLST